MQQNFPCFSVIIPQKNRAEYLYHTIRTCMIQDYPNFEILVSDDCSDDNSVEVVKQLMTIDKRIRLFAHDHHLGMRENFEYVLNKVKPGYVMALGGDDGLIPGAIWRMYEILKDTGLELLTWTPHLFYYPEKPNGKSIICVKRYKEYYVKKLRSEDFLTKISQTFDYMTYDCPMFYIKGVASTELVEKVKARTKDNYFYSCPTPDGYSGVVLSGEVEEYAFTNEPLSITGSSPKSQGKNYMRNDDASKKESVEFFNDNAARPMHKELASQPYSPMIPLMTADYLLTARDLPGWPGKFPELSYDNLITCSINHLATMPFHNDVISRELRILREIAIQHNLLDLFNETIIKTKRKVVWEKEVFGFAITNSIRIDGKEVGANNIFEASLLSYDVSKVYHKVSVSGFIEAINNTLKILLRNHKYKKEPFPMI